MFFHDDLAVFLEDPGIDELRAIGAKRLGGLGKTFLESRDGRTSVGSLGLQYLKFRHV
jgi:hypothetical protein